VANFNRTYRLFNIQKGYLFLGHRDYECQFDMMRTRYSEFMILGTIH